METTIWCSGFRVSGFTITRGPFRGATITRIIFWSKSVASPATAGRRTEGPTPNCKLYWVAVKELNLSCFLGDALSFTIHIYIYVYVYAQFSDCSHPKQAYLLSPTAIMLAFLGKPTHEADQNLQAVAEELGPQAHKNHGGIAA